MTFKKRKNEFKMKKSYQWRRNAIMITVLISISVIAGFVSQYG